MLSLGGRAGRRCEDGRQYAKVVNGAAHLSFAVTYSRDCERKEIEAVT